MGQTTRAEIRRQHYAAGLRLDPEFLITVGR